MSKPYRHAESSARKFGGRPEDYLLIHNTFDSTKGAIADNRHRALLHNSWAIQPGGVFEMMFGVNFLNSDGKMVVVRDVCEQHIIEDFGFIPTAQDYLQEMEFRGWMNNGKGQVPPSYQRIEDKKVTRRIDIDRD